jgi:hypothetical protein
VVKFQTEELVLWALNLFVIGLHPCIMTTLILHDLVDDELVVSSDVEAPYSQLDGDAQTNKQGFVFDHIVGCNEVEAYDIVKIYSEG